MKKRNKFAEKLMEIMNEEILQHEHGCCTIESTESYTRDKELLFIDSDEEKFTATELFHWFNVLMYDKDNIADDVITDNMRIWHGKALEAGFIDKDTPKYW